MSSKLIPSNPADVMTIRNITPNVVTLSVPFLRAGLFRIGGRATLVKLTSGSLLVFSPVALTDEVKAKVAEMGGRVAYIVAPDMEHHIFVSEWKAAYPSAKIIGPAGLPEKRAKQKDEKVSDDEFFAVIDSSHRGGQRPVDPEFDADFEYEYVDAHPNKEIALFYKPDKVLIEADLMFNLPAVEQYSRVPDAEKQDNFANRSFRSFQVTEGDMKWARRYQWYLIGGRNRQSLNESVQRIDGWDFVTVIPCHGETIEGDGKERYRRVFAWHLPEKKAQVQN